MPFIFHCLLCYFGKRYSRGEDNLEVLPYYRKRVARFTTIYMYTLPSYTYNNVNKDLNVNEITYRDIYIYIHKVKKENSIYHLSSGMSSELDSDFVIF